MTYTTISRNGNITIPAAIRRKYGWTGGRRLAFSPQENGTVMLCPFPPAVAEAPKQASARPLAYELNPGGNAEKFLTALAEMQKAFEGEAERVGWKTEEDVEAACKEVRREMWKERYDRNA